MDYELYASGTHSKANIIKRSMTTLSEISKKTRDDLSQSLINSFHVFIGEPLKEFEFNVRDKQAIVEIEKKYSSRDWNFLL
jgi:aminopeptidase C